MRSKKWAILLPILSVTTSCMNYSHIVVPKAKYNLGDVVIAPGVSELANCNAIIVGKTLDFYGLEKEQGLGALYTLRLHTCNHVDMTTLATKVYQLFETQVSVITK